MKKFTFVFMTVAMSMAFVNCSSDDDKGSALDCVTHGNRIADAMMAYTSNNTTSNCNAYRDALQAAIDDGCMATTYQEILDSLDCN